MHHVRNALLRGGIPLVIMVGIGIALLATGNADDGKSTLMAAIVVGAVGAASVIYDIDAWPLRRRIGAHFLVMCVTVLPTLFVSGWFPTETPLDWLVIVGVFLLTGAVILTVIGLGIWLVSRIRRQDR